MATRIVANSLHPHVAMMARRYLFILYNRMLERARLLPSDEIYRGNLEDHAYDRLSICREEVDLSMIEKRIGCGGVQDLIHQAHAELYQLDLLLKWAPWKPDSFWHRRMRQVRLFGIEAVEFYDVSKAI